MRFALRLRAALAASLLLGGCALFGPGLEPPEVFLVGLVPLPGGGLEQRFQVELRVLNPNDRELHIDGVDLVLDVNGTRLTRGVGNESVRIPRLGEGLVRLTATTTVFDLFRQVLAASDRADLSYDLRGRVFLAGGPGSLRFSRQGVFTPPDPASPPAPQPRP